MATLTPVSLPPPSRLRPNRRNTQMLRDELERDSRRYMSHRGDDWNLSPPTHRSRGRLGSVGGDSDDSDFYRHDRRGSLQSPGRDRFAYDAL